MSWFSKRLVALTAAWVLASFAGVGAAGDKPPGVVSSHATPNGIGLTQVAVRSPDEILLGSAGGAIWEWNPRNHSLNELRPASAPGTPISNLYWDENAQLFARSGGLWEIRSPDGETRQLGLPNLTQMAVSPTGQQLAGVAEDPPILFFDSQSGEKTLRVDRQVWVDEMHYSPTGDYLATVRYGRVYLWSTATGDLVWKSRLEGKIKGIAFSPDQSRIFASLEKEGLWVLDVKTGDILTRHPRLRRADPTPPRGANEDRIRHFLACSPDGTLLAVSSDPDQIEIWETFTGRPILLLEKHPGDITGMQFLSDGTRFVSVDDLGHAYLWDLSSPDFAAPFLLVPRGVPFSEEQLGQLWGALGEPRGALVDPREHAAWSALVALRHCPDQALALLDDPPNDDLLIRKLIERLNDDEFAVRQSAYQALRQLSLKAEPFLMNTLSTSPSAEVKVRIRRLLAYQAGPHRESQIRLLKESQIHRQMRVVLLLKWIGTSEAKQRLMRMRDTSEQPVVRRQAEITIQWLESRTAKGEE